MGRRRDRTENVLSCEAKGQKQIQIQSLSVVNKQRLFFNHKTGRWKNPPRTAKKNGNALSEIIDRLSMAYRRMSSDRKPQLDFGQFEGRGQEIVKD